MGGISGIKMFSMAQLSTIIESLFHQAVSNESKTAKYKLITLRQEIALSAEFLKTAVYWKVNIAVAHLENNHNQVISMIDGGSFSKEEFNFLRFVYKESEKALNLQTSATTALARYPASIDPRDAFGIPDTIAEYLDDYYRQKTRKKTALDVPNVSKVTGLTENVIKSRFRHYRELRMTRKFASKDQFEYWRETKPQKKWEVRVQRPQVDPFTYVNPHAIETPRSSDMFTLYRVPLSEPLSIIIPDFC